MWSEKYQLKQTWELESVELKYITVTERLNKSIAWTVINSLLFKQLSALRVSVCVSVFPMTIGGLGTLVVSVHWVSQKSKIINLGMFVRK